MQPDQQPTTAANRSTTQQRGFTTYDEFPDTYGNAVVVRESSSARGSRVWVFVTAAAAGGEPGPTVGAHLSVDQAGRLRDALEAFLIDQGEPPDA